MKKFWPLLTVFLLVGLGLGSAFFLRTKTIFLSINGAEHVIKTSAQRVGAVLNQAGIALSDRDQLSPSIGQWIWGGERIHLEQAARVSILVDGKMIEIVSSERSPVKLMSSAEIPLGFSDKILLASQAAPKILPFFPTFTLQVQREIPIRMNDGKKVISFTTTAASLGQALWEQEVRLRAGDRVEPPLTTPLQAYRQDGLDVNIRYGREAVIVSSGEKLLVYSAAETVGELLSESGIPLQGMDYSRPAESEPVPIEEPVWVIRVHEELLVEQTPLPFETEYQPAQEVELDQKNVIQTGEYGLLSRRIRILHEDGVEVLRQAEEEWVSRPPRNRIVGYGTKVVMHTLDTPNGPINYWRSLQMWATSYHPSITSNRTASGMPLKKGVAAVDTRLIPFYTRMYVPGYGEAVAADVGGGVRGRMIDLGYSDDDFTSWHQWVTVYFLWPPPENIVWNIP
jgi:resuscitation-promoting factor RpfB